MRTEILELIEESRQHYDEFIKAIQITGDARLLHSLECFATSLGFLMLQEDKKEKLEEDIKVFKETLFLSKEFVKKWVEESSKKLTQNEVKH